jgi:hypothetical protein
MYYVFFKLGPNFMFGKGLYMPSNPITQSDYNIATYTIHREQRKIVGPYHAISCHHFGSQMLTGAYAMLARLGVH